MVMDAATPPTPTLERMALERERDIAAQVIDINRRDAIAREAENYNVPIEVWGKMSADQRADIMRLRPAGYQQPDEAVRDEAERRHRANDQRGLLTGSEDTGTLARRAKEALILSPNEQKDWVVLYDPPQYIEPYGWVTVGSSRVPRRAMQTKLDMGFTIDLSYPEIPEPPAEFRCNMRDGAGHVCAFRGHPDINNPHVSTQLEEHQRAKHRASWEAKKTALEQLRVETLTQSAIADRELREREIALRERELALRELELLRQPGGAARVAMPTPTDDAPVAADPEDADAGSVTDDDSGIDAPVVHPSKYAKPRRFGQ